MSNAFPGVAREFPLSQGPRELAARGVRITYARLLRHVIDADVPADRRGSRYFISPDEVHAALVEVSIPSNRAAVAA